jgi:hypothetical protein
LEGVPGQTNTPAIATGIVMRALIMNIHLFFVQLEDAAIKGEISYLQPAIPLTPLRWAEAPL